ncbi:MAG TPA: DUF502 domain-containing protein [Polyangia bacterium]|nr:DUF502 domain-containing protein [Polyangia bacterium]
MGRLQNHVRNKLFAGLLAAVPVAVTAFILWYVDTRARGLFGVSYPFLGIAITVGGIYVLGLFITSLIGRFLLGLMDGLLRRIPGLRDLYRSWKQIALTSEGHEGIFAHVVLIPDESGALRMLGFTSGEALDGDPDVCCVFVPASPNPTSGRLYFVPVRRCLPLDLRPQEALKILISGGNYVPAAIGRATARLAALT